MKTLFALVNIGFLLFIAYQVWRRDQSPVRKVYWPALLTKLIAGICVGLVYTYYYSTGDTIGYFDDGVLLADFARADLPSYCRFLWSGDETAGIWNNQNFLQTRTLFMVKIVSIVNLLSHDNYWVSSLYFSFASFLSAWYLVNVIIRVNTALRYAAAIGFLFFPSIVFWSSGVIKESLAMASLFFLTSVFLKFWLRERLKWWEWILVPFAIWLAWKLKYYYLAVFLPVVIASLAVRLVFFDRLKYRPVIYRVLLWCIFFFIPVLIASTTRPNFYPERFLAVIISNNAEFQAISNDDDLIHYNSLQPTVGSILKNAPWALFSGLFRKLPWEAGTLFQLISSLENILLLLLACAALRNVNKMVRSPNRLLLYSIIVYTVILCVFLALSTPNFGTLSRYRVSFVPYFFLLISIENPILEWIIISRQRSSDRLVR